MAARQRLVTVLVRPSTCLVAFLLATACSAKPDLNKPRGFTVIAEYPHDTAAYTQGLLFRAPDELLESTGLYGQSSLRRVGLQAGQPKQLVRLPPARFGEGLTRLNGKLFQLTWRSEIAYVYNESTLQLIDSVRYDGEGWGLTSDSTTLIMSNGSDTLYVREPRTFAIIRRIPVRYPSGIAVPKLNELEHADGEVFANVYQSDWVLRIDLSSGVVTEVLDLSMLLPKFNARATTENVLNGLALDPRTGHLLVTGKRWPQLFELRLDKSPRGGGR